MSKKRTLVELWDYGIKRWKLQRRGERDTSFINDKGHCCALGLLACAFRRCLLQHEDAIIDAASAAVDDIDNFSRIIEAFNGDHFTRAQMRRLFATIDEERTAQ